jgi:outer membrane protein OmpA-like peptidoglycan-associated protein
MCPISHVELADSSAGQVCEMLEHENGDERTDGRSDLEVLRSLLFSREKQELTNLRTRFDNRDVRAQDVSEVVAEALRLRSAADADNQLSGALTPAVEQALRESVRKDARVLAEALYPVMGPAIRRSIYEAISALLQSFNQALAQGLSVKGVKWRIEAVRTGRPFAEVVLLHTLVYRVEQVFLIHKKTGILLQHLAISTVAIQDPDLVSGMLSAIQDFMKDSFDPSQGASVNALQVGDLQVWVEQGPEAALASVIRGHPPQRIRFKMKEILELIHTEFGPELDRFEGDTSPFLSSSETLSGCLESKADEKKPFQSRKNTYLVVFATVALILLWAVTSFRDGHKWTKFAGGLNNEPGIVVTSLTSQGGRYRIRGLRDPESVDPESLVAKAGLDPGRVEFEWRPFYALDDPLILKRATSILQPTDGVSLSVTAGVLSISGNCDEDWAAHARSLAPLAAGVQSVDYTRLVVSSVLSRETQAVESISVLFGPGATTVRDDQRGQIDQIAGAINTLLAKARQSHQAVAIEIVGHTDSTGSGTKNSQVSRQRAGDVLRRLVQAKIPENLLSAGAGEPVRQENTEADRQYNRSVTLRVVPGGPGGEH